MNMSDPRDRPSHGAICDELMSLDLGELGQVEASVDYEWEHDPGYPTTYRPLKVVLLNFPKDGEQVDVSHLLDDETVRNNLSSLLSGGY